MKRYFLLCALLIWLLVLVIGSSKQTENVSGIWVSSNDWEGCETSGNISGTVKIDQQGDTIIITNLDNKVEIKGIKKGDVISFKGGTFPLAQDGSNMTFQDWQMTISEDGNSIEESVNWTLDRYGCPGVSRTTYTRKVE